MSSVALPDPLASLFLARPESGVHTHEIASVTCQVYPPLSFASKHARFMDLQRTSCILHEECIIERTVRVDLNEE